MNAQNLTSVQSAPVQIVPREIWGSGLLVEQPMHITPRWEPTYAAVGRRPEAPCRQPRHVREFPTRRQQFAMVLLGLKLIAGDAVLIVRHDLGFVRRHTVPVSRDLLRQVRHTGAFLTGTPKAGRSCLTSGVLLFLGVLAIALLLGAGAGVLLVALVF